MLRSAELWKEPESRLSLLFNDSDTQLAKVFSQIESEFNDSDESQTVMVELPSSLMYEDFEIEAWLESKAHIQVEFQGLLSEESHLLGPHYLEFYEEFARSTQSKMVFARSKLKREQPIPLIESSSISFGRHVSVFEDDLFGDPVSAREPDLLERLANSEEELEEIYFPILSQSSDYLIEKVFAEVAEEGFGEVWGMELLRLSNFNESGEVEFRLHTRNPAQFFHNISRLSVSGPDSVSVKGLSHEVGMLRLSGVGLRQKSLREYLVANELIQES